MNHRTPPDADDYFSETRMTFGDHIEELRSHLWRAIAGFIVALIVCFTFGDKAVHFITSPVKQQLGEFYNRRAAKTMKDLDNDPYLQSVNRPTGFTKVRFYRDQLKAVLRDAPAEEMEKFAKRPVLQDEEKKNEEPGFFDKLLGRAPEKKELKDDEQRIAQKDVVELWMEHSEPLREMGFMQRAMRIIGDLDNMATMNIMEGFMVWFKVCVVCGIILGSPWIFWQIWMFVAAGLYPHEKRLVHVYLPISLGLFLIGVLVCEFLVLPRAIEALLWFNEWLGLKPDLRLNEWLSFAIWMPLIFGVSFQTPLVMMFTARLGIISAETFRNKRRYAWFGMAVFAAIVTPTPDAVTMLFLWVPMSLLFELGIWLIKLTPPDAADLDAEEPNADELIEV